MNLFDLFAKITLDDSEYISGINNASKTTNTLTTKLEKGLALAGKAGAASLGLITGAATTAVTGLLVLENSTEEYRIAQGKLNTAFEAAGYSGEVASDAYKGLYRILGDTDTATEAAQLMARLSNSAEDMAVWTDVAAGVYGTFGDALPIESLIEAANETAKVGTVTGTLADALNWAGISEDAFNEALSACTSESERNRLIMDTLASTYDTATDAFYRNNEEILKSRDAQAQLDEGLAKVGESVSRVKNAFLQQFAPAISEVADDVAEFINEVDTEKLCSKFENAFSAVKTIWDGAKPYFEDDVMPAIDGALDVFEGVATGDAEKAFNGMVTIFNNGVEMFGKIGINLGKSLVEGIKSYTSTVNVEDFLLPSTSTIQSGIDDLKSGNYVTPASETTRSPTPTGTSANNQRGGASSGGKDSGVGNIYLDSQKVGRVMSNNNKAYGAAAVVW